MIINEEIHIDKDPTLLLNLAATCANCPWGVLFTLDEDGDPLEYQCRYNPTPARATHSYFCSRHPYRLITIPAIQGEEPVEKPKKRIKPGGIGYNDPEGHTADPDGYMFE